MDDVELRDVLRRRWYLLAVLLVSVATGAALAGRTRQRRRNVAAVSPEPPPSGPAGGNGAGPKHVAASTPADALGAAMAAHRAQSVEVLRSGDPTAIKNLYGDLGTLLETAVGDDVDKVPVLSYAETAQVTLQLMSRHAGRILDAGCGPNPSVSVVLAKDPSRFVVGMDIGLGTVRLARAIAARSGVQLHGVVADLEALPFRHGVFDAVVCDDTIEHVPDDVTAISELARVLSPGGRMVLATPNRHSAEILRRKLADLGRGRRRSARHYYIVNSHLREYTWSSLAMLVRPLFAIRRRASVGWTGNTAHRVLTAATRRGPLRHFSRMIVMELEPLHHARTPEAFPAAEPPPD